MALGADRQQVLWMTAQQGLIWIGTGVALGVPLALSAARVARGLLFGLSAADAGVLLASAAVLSAMGLLAAYIPARRASTRSSRCVRSESSQLPASR
jgi:ABC-type antimicrobial peptide transport system permease subunit